MIREPSAEVFLKDVAEHRMTVLLYSGIYRHLKFKAPKNSWNMWFELVTWPGHLTVSGDMGTWTFARLEDMFEFFRSPRELAINASYWAEKLRGGVHGGRESAMVYNQELFAKRLLAQLSEYYGFEGEELAEITQAVKDEVLTDDWEGAVKTAARDFTHEFETGATPCPACKGVRSFLCSKCDGGEICRKFHFDMCEIPDGKDYSYHFIWCLYAIVWGIQQYDALILSQAEAKASA